MTQTEKKQARQALPVRTTEEVLKDHLELSKHGTVEEDVKRNFSEDVVLLTSFGVYHGHTGMISLAHLLRKQVPHMHFTYKDLCIEGETGFLEWSADAAHTEVRHGADTYVVRNGLIVAQTIHYSVQLKQDNESAPPVHLKT